MSVYCCHTILQHPSSTSDSITSLYSKQLSKVKGSAENSGQEYLNTYCQTSISRVGFTIVN